MVRVCIVEDDEQIERELRILLERNEYEVYACSHFETLVDEIFESASDIILLDLNLPFIDGHVVCREIRERSTTPIIVVTSRDSDLDELMSMNLGADDFVSKPYSPQILLARIASVLRRTNEGPVQSTQSYKKLILDSAKSRVLFEGQEAELTKNEMRILDLMIQNAETIVAREKIQNELWQSDQFIDDNTLTVNINRLRSKLEDIGAQNYLHTKRGLGYYLEDKA
ncbi:MAG: response regulator transcription factor [Raoultibacter sp.]|jgi:DNA-binding response OmpR family regulator